MRKTFSMVSRTGYPLDVVVEGEGVRQRVSLSGDGVNLFDLRASDAKRLGELLIQAAEASGENTDFRGDSLLGAVDRALAQSRDFFGDEPKEKP